MKKNDLKQLIKPLVKECMHEVLLEEGLLSNVVAEVAKGLRAKVILGIIGLVMTGKDLYRFVMGDIENMTEEEIDTYADEIIND